MAAHSGVAAHVQLLLVHGADLSLKDCLGDTAAHVASRNGHADALECLLAYHADVTVRDKMDETAADVICQFGKNEHNKARIETMLRQAARGIWPAKKSQAQDDKSKLAIAQTISAFLTLLLDAKKEGNITDSIAALQFCQRLSATIVNLIEAKNFYPVLRSAVAQDLLTRPRAVELLHPALEIVAKKCVNQDTFVFFQMVIEKCHQDGWISREDFLRYRDTSQLKRIEHADFIVDIKEMVAYNTKRIDNLESTTKAIVKNMQVMSKNIQTLSKNVEQVHGGVQNLKSGLKFKARMDGIIDMVSGVLGSLTLGIGGALGGACKAVFNKVVDFADAVHITRVIQSEVKDMGLCNYMIESVRQGAAAVDKGVDMHALAELAGAVMVGNYTDKHLEDSLNDDKPLFPLCVVGFASAVVAPNGAGQAGSSPPAPALQPTKAPKPAGKEDAAFEVWPDAIFDEKIETNKALELHGAVKYGDMEFLQDTLDDLESSRVNDEDDCGRTAMDLAALTGQLEMMSLLKKAGGSFSFGLPARMRATAKKRSSAAEEYVKYMHESL